MSEVAEFVRRFLKSICSAGLDGDLCSSLSPDDELLWFSNVLFIPFILKIIFYGIVQPLKVKSKNKIHRLIFTSEYQRENAVTNIHSFSFS